MGKSKIKQSAQYAYKDKKLKGKPGAGSMFIQLKSLKSLLGLKNGGDTMLKGDQVKLDKNKDGKISGEDFKMMQAKSGKMMKAYKGDMAKGYGAARTQGEGLQDENLIPGKSLDYYKDVM